MESNKYAFTLIELLVVILIIGILAVMALPQYQVAVAKARAKRLMSLMSSILKAEQTYKLANGDYTTNFEQLDVTMPAGGSDTCSFTKLPCKSYDEYACLLDNISISCYLFTPDIRISAPYSGRYWACWDNGNTDLGAKVCKSLSGTDNRQANNAYIFHENWEKSEN